MLEPEDRRRDEKYAERKVWRLSNGDRPRLAVAETPEEKSSHRGVCPIQNSYLSEFAPRVAKSTVLVTRAVSAQAPFPCAGSMCPKAPLYRVLTFARKAGE
jgi:hypothetical protein